MFALVPTPPRRVRQTPTDPAELAAFAKRRESAAVAAMRAYLRQREAPSVRAPTLWQVAALCRRAIAAQEALDLALLRERRMD